MSPEFNELTKNYDTYKESNDIVDNPNENPYEKLSNAFFLLYSCLPPDKVSTIQSLVSVTENLAKVQRENQLIGRKAIRHLRRFFTVEYKELMDERTKLEKARTDMDLMKQEVKEANTTEKIEKYAILYEQAVEEFDGQARRTIVLLNQLPKIKTIHLV
ncbi:hypothetical protein LOAG_04266 [Loa loa]|uniref:BAR domain-containing protein n=2 Tax=Loa loa TaxID=7209 RepID=A0A1S0U2Z7_LOALO|nr:hypothetical protein LOAG_04266 [Loa loa]EFO24216.2 hypothetical protein LOAG_04266 [Loa loa]